MSSSSRKEELLSNLSAVKSQFPSSTSAGHDASHVSLIAVSKLKPASDIRILYDAGHRHFGENYIQELIQKSGELPGDVRWHFIGGLQSNKCKTLASSVPNLWAVETLDSLKKANALNAGRRALDASRSSSSSRTIGDGDGGGREMGDKLRVYVQVNTSGEAEKSGVSGFEEAETLMKHVMSECECLEVYGVMTIGALASSRSEEENQDFKKLRDVKEKLESSLGIALKLSMGMSNDYVEAIRQGSDQVRVGSKIFGARPPKKSQEVEEKTAEGKS